MRPNHFIGLVVPSRAADGTPWFADRVPDPPPGIRRFDATDLHVTIAFLGPVEEDAAARAWRALPALGTPFDVRLGAVLALGRPRRYSALSARVDADHDRIARRIGAVRGPLLEIAGAPPETRPVLPHVTVARPTRAASPSQRQAGRAWGEGLDLHGVALRLDTLAWFTWAEDRRGRLFRVVDRRSTRDGPGRVGRA